MEGSINFLSFIITIGTFLSLTLGFFLLFNKSAKNKANIYLGLVAFCAFLHVLCPFVYFMGWLDELPFLYRSERLAGFLVGPMIYFYIRSCTQKDFKMSPILLIHFLPAVLDLFFHIPIMMINPEQKVEYFNRFMETGIFAHHKEHQLIPLAKIIHAIFYGIISAKLVLQYRKHLTETTSLIDEAFHRWLLVFCSFLIYPFFIIFAFVIFNGQIINLSSFYFGYVSWVIAIYFSTLFKPELFHAFPHQIVLPDSSEENTQKYESSNLKETQKEEYLTTLLSYFEKEKPFLEPELTLTQLSEQTKIPTHHLSQVINEKQNCTFLDFVNSHRVIEAKEKLTNKKYSHYTILAVAFDSGFNSKTTFYSSFKKHTGTTPSNYRKSNQKKSI